MRLEDIVRQALEQAGHKIPDEVQQNLDQGVDTPDTQITPADSNDVIPTDDEQTQQLIAEILIEFIRKQRISFAQLASMRRVFKRVLMHLCLAESPCTVGNIRNVIDPRYRKQVPILLQEMTKAGILSMFDDDTAKARWYVSPQYKAQAIMFASEK